MFYGDMTLRDIFMRLLSNVIGVVYEESSIRMVCYFHEESLDVSGLTPAQKLEKTDHLDINL